MKLQLTISLLVSNRRETIERCLDSVTPLLRELDSELVIVWTGSDPEILEVVKQYTDNIIPFAWCNDFSKARNVGYEAAKGEWFLYLDDDEWFEDVSPIIEFFRSGEEKRYNSAVYIQRNYDDWAGRSYADNWVGRMCRRRPDVRFVNPVHEAIMPTYSPRKKLDAFVHHYGYVKKSKRMQEKTGRNLPLVLQAIEAEPDNLHHRHQLVLEYASQERYDEAIDEALKALEIGRNARDGREEITSLQVLLLTCLILHGKSKEAEEKCREFLADKDSTNTARMFFSSYLLQAMVDNPALFRKEGLPLLREHDEVCKVLADQPEESVEIVTGKRNDVYIGQRSPILFEAGAEAAFAEGDFEQAGYWLSRIPWGTSYVTLENCRKIEAWKRGSSAKEKILELLACVEGEDGYLKYQKALYLVSEGRADEAHSYFAECVKLAQEWLYPLLVKTGLEQGWDCAQLILKFTGEQWRDTILDILKGKGRDECERLAAQFEKIRESCPVYYGFCQLRLEEERILQGEVTGKELFELLNRYCENVLRFYEKIYSQDLLERAVAGQSVQEEMLLEPDCRFALAYRSAFGKEDLEEEVRACGRLYRVYPRMALAVSRLLDYLRGRLERESSTIPPEFFRLAEQVKQQARVLLQAGQKKAALDVVEQLMRLVPSDREVIRMKQQILKQMAEESEE